MNNMLCIRVIKWSRVITNELVSIETTASLESFRRFLIISTCKSFMPESYIHDPEVFPEREGTQGFIYIEAADKVTLKKYRDVTFVNAKDILGIIYSSKSGNTKLRWRQIRKRIGKVTGVASVNALVNLVESGVLSREWINRYLGQMHTSPSTPSPPSSSSLSPSDSPSVSDTETEVDTNSHSPQTHEQHGRVDTLLSS
jgi:hypothetical protein